MAIEDRERSAPHPERTAAQRRTPAEELCCLARNGRQPRGRKFTGRRCGPSRSRRSWLPVRSSRKRTPGSARVMTEELGDILASLRPFQGRARRRLTVRSRSAFVGARADQAFRPKPRARSIAPTSCSSAALPSRAWTHKAQTTAATRQRGASPKAQQVRTTANDADAAMAAAYAGNLEPLRARSTVSFIGARAPTAGRLNMGNPSPSPASARGRTSTIRSDPGGSTHFGLSAQVRQAVRRR